MTAREEVRFEIDEASTGTATTHISYTCPEMLAVHSAIVSAEHITNMRDRVMQTTDRKTRVALLSNIAACESYVWQSEAAVREATCTCS